MIKNKRVNIKVNTIYKLNTEIIKNKKVSIKVDSI